MILTPKKLDEIARDIWGEDWIAVVSDRLHRARKTLKRYKDEERPIPPDFRDEFSRMVDDQLNMVARHHQYLREGVSEDF